MRANDSKIAKRLAEYLQALDEDKTRAEAVLATFDAEERAELNAYVMLANRLGRVSDQIAAVNAGPSEKAFLARLNAETAGHRRLFPWLQGTRVASRSVLAGWVMFVGLALGAASAFGDDPLDLSRALPFSSSSSVPPKEPVEADKNALPPNPLRTDSETADPSDAAPRQDGAAPGASAENPGNGVGPDGDPPGQGGENPGNGVGPGGDPPGQGGENPGNGVGAGGDPPNGAGNGNGQGNAKP